MSSLPKQFEDFYLATRGSAFPSPKQLADSSALRSEPWPPYVSVALGKGWAEAFAKADQDYRHEQANIAAAARNIRVGIREFGGRLSRSVIRRAAKQC